jgi:cell division protein FtsW
MGLGTYIKSTANKNPAVPARRVKPQTSDLILVATVIALCVFGLLMVFSASTDYSLQAYLEEKGPVIAPYYIFYKQLVLMLAGVLVAVVLSRLDYHIFRNLAVPMMAVALALLLGVLFFGEDVLGSKRTFIGGSLQPSELAKLVTIIYLAVWLHSKREYLHDVLLGLIPLAFILGAIGGLILLEPDISAAMTIIVLGGLLFFLAGGDLKQIFVLVLISLAAGWMVLQFSKTGRDRLAEYLMGLKDPLQSSDHMLYSLESMVNGGFFGVGIGNAALKVEGLPFAATDSVFAVIVEELGLVGAATLIVLYGVLVWRGMKIAERAPDQLGKVLAGGLTFWIGIEALMNMAVMVGLLPFAGNALPFISAGGSNLLSILAAVGLLVSISRQAGKKSPEKALGKEERRSYGASVDLRRGNRRRSLPRARRP